MAATALWLWTWRGLDERLWDAHWKCVFWWPYAASYAASYAALVPLSS